MTNRTNTFLNLREPQIGQTSSETSSEELFQNKTLRPILKLQNDLFIAVFNEYIKRQKNVFSNLTTVKKEEFIDNAVHRDFKFRDFLIGLVVGLFTLDEFNEYSLNASNLNKRIINLLATRLKNQF